jgi:hypothetical protein
MAAASPKRPVRYRQSELMSTTSSAKRCSFAAAPAAKAVGAGASNIVERDLGAGDEGAQFLEQFAVFALESFFDRFIVGSFPESLLDHFVGGHVCPSGGCRALR